MSQTPGAGYWTDSAVDVYTPLDEVEWRSVDILEGEYRFDLPVPLALWDVFPHWERERIHSMREHLEHGMTLFDVGTEQGWCNLLYASMVGPENMVLIEPTREFWPNIKATWERNYGSGLPQRDDPAHPLALYHGLISDKTTDDRDWFFAWPECSDGPLIDRNKYQYIHDHDDTTLEMTMDDLVERSGVAPDAITIDVEGAELLVLRGAVGTLWEHRPLVWCSVHPDLMERDYGYTPDHLHKLMSGQGYKGTHLATDHESHYLFEPQ